MLMGVSAPSGVEPCRGRTTFTPNTQARLDELILLTRLSWDTWRRRRGGGQEVGRLGGGWGEGLCSLTWCRKPKTNLATAR